MKCKSYCKEFGLYDFNYKLTGRGSPRYSKGYLYCSICKYYVPTDKLYCPCCGIKYRTKKRNHKIENIKHLLETSK